MVEQDLQSGGDSYSTETLHNYSSTIQQTTSSESLPETGLEIIRPSEQVVIEVMTLCVLWAASVIGNVLVCVVIYRSRRMQSTTNYFVVSLAISDVIFSLVCIPFIFGRILANCWPFGSLLCKLVRFVQYMLPGASMYVLVAICVDRFYTIIYPLSFKITRGTAKRMILCGWLVAGVISTFTFYFFEMYQIENYPDKQYCPTYISTEKWPGMVYALSCIVLHYIAPLLLIAIGYFKLFKYIWRAKILGKTFFQRTMNPVPRAKVKMVKMLMIVTLTSVCLNAPFYCVHLWSSLVRVVYVEPTVFIFVVWAMYSGGVTKPLIYLCYNSNFRRGCREVFCMSTMKCYRSNTYAITTASTFGKKNHIGIMETNSGGPQSLDSPTKAFNRATLMEKTAWPIKSVMPSTYL